MAFRNLRARAIAAGYRSGLEEDIGKQLKTLGVKAEYEPFPIPYTVPTISRKYTPDYVLPNGIIIYLRDTHGTSLDIRFVFNNPRSKLRKGAKTTYADWCEKHGFHYAKKEIPEEWINEKPRKRCLSLIERLRG
jgi:hypothetical protein